MPSASCCFFACFWFSRKSIPNEVQMPQKFTVIFLEHKRPRSFEEGPEDPRGSDKPAPRAPQACRFLMRLLVLSRSFGGLFWSTKNHHKFSAHSENFYFCTKNDTMVVLLKIASVRLVLIKSYQNHIKLL